MMSDSPEVKMFSHGSKFSIGREELFVGEKYPDPIKQAVDFVARKETQQGQFSYPNEFDAHEAVREAFEETGEYRGVSFRYEIKNLDRVAKVG
jgi:small-conductance mechanosensitive channel